MKKTTKRKIREIVKKGVVDAGKITKKVKKISSKTVSYMKGKLPNRKEVKGATRVVARLASKTAIVAKNKTKKMAGMLMETGRDVMEGVIEGVKDAKRESKKA